MKNSKKISSQLPKIYKDTISSYIKEVQQTLGEKIKLILLIGSSSSGKVISDWSDIDIIIVLEQYKMEYIEKIKNIVKNYDIKIGNTIYSKIEFENKKIDPKTFYYLLLVQKEIIPIQYCSSDLNIPKISELECKNAYHSWLMEHFHSYKRIWLYTEIPNEKIREIFKNTYLIMKSILIINGYYPQNYEQVFYMYSNEFKIEKFEFKKFIKSYQNKTYDKEKLINFAQKFSEDLSNNLKV